jgi:hypothetical protein
MTDVSKELLPDENELCARERAKAFLAAAVGMPVESDTEMSLADKDQVFVSDAIEAIVSAMDVSDEVERLREARVEDSGLFLALGIMLSGPIDEPNRSHFAKKCFDAADAITPGVSKDARQALTLSGGGS